MIGIFGTSDVENYGDLLYPPIFEHLLARAGCSVPARAFAFLPAIAPAGAGYATHSISGLLHARERVVDALCIGGGDILRTDFRTMAAHYVPQFARMPERHPYWWLRRKWSGKRRQARVFISRFMNFDCVGPLVLNAATHPKAAPLAYWSCGVPFDFEPAEQDALSAAMDSAAYIYVRDAASAAKLRRAGVKGPVHVAPDAIVTLSDRYDMKHLKALGRRIFADQGIDVNRRILGFQAVRLTSNVVAEIAPHLLRHVGETGDEVALIPIGHCHGDQAGLATLAEACSGAVKLVSVRQVEEIMAAVAACDAFVGTSLHGNITAFSFGIPHLAGPLAVEKLQGFIDVVGLEAETRLTRWSQLHDRLRWLRSRPDGYWSSRAERAKAAVYRTFDEMLAHLRLPLQHA